MNNYLKKSEVSFYDQNWNSYYQEIARNNVGISYGTFANSDVSASFEAVKNNSRTTLTNPSNVNYTCYVGGSENCVKYHNYDTQVYQSREYSSLRGLPNSAFKVDLELAYYLGANINQYLDYSVFIDRVSSVPSISSKVIYDKARRVIIDGTENKMDYSNAGRIHLSIVCPKIDSVDSTEIVNTYPESTISMSVALLLNTSATITTYWNISNLSIVSF